MDQQANQADNSLTPPPDENETDNPFAEFETDTPAVDDAWPQDYSPPIDTPAGEEFEHSEAWFDTYPDETFLDYAVDTPYIDNTIEEHFDSYPDEHEHDPEAHFDAPVDETPVEEHLVPPADGHVSDSENEAELPAGDVSLTHATEVHPVDDPSEASFATPVGGDPPENSLEDTDDDSAQQEAKNRTITQELAVIRQNRAKLSQIEIWREIVAELPRRTKWSLGLVAVLATCSLIGYNVLLSAPVQEIRVSLPQKILSALPHTATPASLESSVAQIGPQHTPTPARIPARTPTPQGTPVFLFHTVTATDTLISIAAQYNVTSEALLVANNLRNPDDLQEGQYLLIPSGNDFTRQKVFVHEVKAGDTLLSIATKYGSSVKDIQAANPGLDSDEALQEGQTVAVPIVFLEANPAITPNDTNEVVVHTIQPGEFPLNIAAQYDIPVEILLSANNISDPTKLQIGQELIIPPHDGISLGFPVILYEWQATDTLIGVATRFGSSVKDILAVNPDLDPVQIEAGQIVAVPVIFQPPRPTPAPDSPAAPRPTPGPPPAGIPSLEEQLVQAVNTERVAHGLPPETFDAQLAKAALQHAQDMYVRDFFAHVNPDGATLSDRLASGGVNFIQAGENIQRNTQPRDKTVQAAVDWFMNSAPHRANILHQGHNRIGVAVVEGPPGWYTFVLNFAER